MNLSLTKIIMSISFLGILLVFTFIFFYVYKSHRDISSEIASFSISVHQTHNDFINDSEANTKKYADKTIETY